MLKVGTKVMLLNKNMAKGTVATAEDRYFPGHYFVKIEGIMGMCFVRLEPKEENVVIICENTR